jgi:hypothetical protein
MARPPGVFSKAVIPEVFDYKDMPSPEPAPSEPSCDNIAVLSAEVVDNDDVPFFDYNLLQIPMKTMHIDEQHEYGDHVTRTIDAETHAIYARELYPSVPPGVHVRASPPHVPHSAIGHAEAVIREVLHVPHVVPRDAAGRTDVPHDAPQDSPPDDCNDDFADLADFHGVKEYGEDQWTAYLERGVPPRDIAPHRSNISSSSSSATIAPASPPMCNAPPVRKQVRFSSSASWTPQPQDVDLEAKSSTYTFISRLGEYFEQYKEVVHVTDPEVAVKAIIDCFHHAVLDEQEARLPREMQMKR